MTEDNLRIVTCTAPVNIAVIKYWGKRDEQLILPINDSVSVTLSSGQMHAKTSVTASPAFTKDRIWLNGVEENSEGSRLRNCLAEVRARAGSGTEPLVPLSWNIHICSENNFPTAAGLASSAAGYACLVSSLCKLYGVEGDVSSIARRGSGSACRSVYGGFVRWHMGVEKDGSDSVAKQVQPAKHWPGMRVIICVASDSRKKTSSSVGMKNSVLTSDLLKHRAEHCVPERTERILKAINDTDFQSFGEITIKDSNQFHAICQDTYPPCVYMNAASHAVCSLIHQLNSYHGKLVACYTFDAGPNACVFLMEEFVPQVAGLVRHFLGGGNQDFLRGEDLDAEEPDSKLLDILNVEKLDGGIKYLIHTSPGEGPEELTNPHDHLLDSAGQPKSLK